MVAGASIAGLHAACILARAGRDVIVLERIRSLDPTARSLIVTATMLDLLGDVGSASVMNRIGSYELIGGEQQLIAGFDRPDLIIERATLLRSLAKEADAIGVRIEVGARVLAIEDGGVRLERSGVEDRIATNEVVVAQGAAGRPPVGVAGWPAPTAPLIQALVRLPDDLPSGRFRVWFRPDLTPYFLWLIPESPTTGALGIIGEHRHDARRILDRFLDEIGLRADGYQAARIPIYEGWRDPIRRIGRTRVLLAGDSAGHVKVSTVGGVVTGLRSAAAAASVVLGHDARRAYLPLRTELGAHLIARRALHGLDAAGYDRLIAAASRSPEILGHATRDDAVRLMASALLANPRLLRASTGALLRSTRFRAHRDR